MSSKEETPTMVRISARLVTALAALFVMASSAPATAQESYRYTSSSEIFAELDTPLPQLALLPTCLSDNGVAGFNTIGISNGSFLIDRTEWEQFFPSGIAGINASGDTVGSTFTPGVGFRAWLRTADGTVTTIGIPDATITNPRSISANGVIGGSFSSGGTRGFLLGRDGHVVVEYPGALSTQVRGVNASGTSVGIAGLPVGTRAFIRYRDGDMELLDIPGQTSSQALGINNQGKIVGLYRNAANRAVGFVTGGRTLTTVDMESDFPPSLTITVEGVPRPVSLVANSASTSVVAVNTRGDILVSASAIYRGPNAPTVASIRSYVGETNNGQ